MKWRVRQVSFNAGNTVILSDACEYDIFCAENGNVIDRFKQSCESECGFLSLYLVLLAPKTDQ